MDRVWKSRGRAGSGFGQSGPGSGRVFADFESRVSGFCRVYNLCKKVDFFKKISAIFEKKNYFFNLLNLLQSFMQFSKGI